jgi:two-component system LytT family response regulator
MSESVLKTLLVDDEQPARERLRRLLDAHDRIEIAGEAEDGEQAMEKIVDLHPDLVFLDIQMPGCDGLEVASSLPSPRPRIIFCTAYDEYAVDAFEVHAVDYLLKPVTRVRLAQAVQRVLAPGEHVPGNVAIERAAREAGPYPSRFLAKRGSRFCVVQRRDVLCFESEGGLTLVRTPRHELWMQPSLQDLEDRLDPVSFLRISRSIIVNLDAVREVVPLPGGQGLVRVEGGAELEVSRRRFKTLMERLGKS